MQQETTNRSTGPKTPEGKARSSMNALKHGLRSSRICVPAALQEDFDEMLPRYRDAFLPINPSGAEELIFESLFKDAWNIFRIELYFGAAHADRIDDPILELPIPQLQSLLTRTKTSYNRNLKQLTTLQTNRFLQRCFPEPLNEQTIPPLADVKAVMRLANQTSDKFPGIAMNTIIFKTTKEAEAAGKGPKAPPVTHQS